MPFGTSANSGVPADSGTPRKNNHGAFASHSGASASWNFLAIDRKSQQRAQIRLVENFPQVRLIQIPVNWPEFTATSLQLTGSPNNALRVKLWPIVHNFTSSKFRRSSPSRPSLAKFVTTVTNIRLNQFANCGKFSTSSLPPNLEEVPASRPSLAKFLQIWRNIRLLGIRRNFD